ncbi:MAG: hypothetical protein U1F46_14110 [Marinagarivorans sp.]
MWKLLGWPLAFAAALGAYWLQVQGQKRERALQDQLQIQQQLVAQVSNRLTVVEAQYALYKAKQEKDAKEREMREREVRDVEHPVARPPVASEHTPSPGRAPAEPYEEPLDESREDTRSRRNASPARSIGNGINSIIDRLRDGFIN